MALKTGNFIEITKDYCFIEPFIGRASDKPVCMKKGDIGQVTKTYKGYKEQGLNIRFKTKSGKVFFDDTSPKYLAGKYRRLDPRKAAAKKKISNFKR